MPTPLHDLAEKARDYLAHEFDRMTPKPSDDSVGGFRAADPELVQAALALSFLEDWDDDGVGEVVDGPSGVYPLHAAA